MPTNVLPALYQNKVNPAGATSESVLAALWAKDLTTISEQNGCLSPKDPLGICIA